MRDEVVEFFATLIGTLLMAVIVLLVSSALVYFAWNNVLAAVTEISKINIWQAVLLTLSLRLFSCDKNASTKKG
jgi:heme/copper-type cytochrome/quinol oxidase subunit 2